VPTFKDLPPELVSLLGRYGLAKRWRQHFEAKLARARAREDAARDALDKAMASAGQAVTHD
jgi:hypothetical protein